MKKHSKENAEWTEKEIKHLSLNLLRILKIFIDSEKPFLDFNEIVAKYDPELGNNSAKKQRVGGVLGMFEKNKKKERLITPVLRLRRGQRWTLNKKYSATIKKVLDGLEPYLD